MVDLVTTRLTLLVLLLSFLAAPSSTRQTKHHKRELVAEPAPLADSGWAVPLEGGQACINSSYCTDQLTPPSSEATLQHLAIGRGTITYSCAGRMATQPPIYITQNAFLYDVSPIISRFSSEDQFHSFIPRFLDFDYTSLDNSSLPCIGNVQRIDGLTIFAIYNEDAFEVMVKETLSSPNDPQFDLDWAHSQDNNQDWEIYRVETAGGGPPYNCGDQLINDEIPAEYVAEYWFYQRETPS